MGTVLEGFDPEFNSKLIHGGHVEISGRKNQKELLRPESVAKFLAFGQARWDDPLKDQEDQTIWLAKWEMSA